MDVVGEMQAVEAAIGGRVGDAVAGAKVEAGRLRGASSGVVTRVRGYVGGLSVAAMVALGFVGVAACASPIAMWSAYHSGKAVEAERERTANAEAVARQAAADRAVVARQSAKLARTDAANRTEIARLHHIADRLSHKPVTRLCPPTVFEVLRGSAEFSPRPGQ